MTKKSAGRPKATRHSNQPTSRLFALGTLLIAAALIIRTIVALLILPVTLRVTLLVLLPIMLMLIVTALTRILMLRVLALLVGVILTLFVTHHITP